MSRARKPEPEGFAEFWELWRPKARSTDGRGDARKTFAQHVKDGVDPQDIVLGAAWFLRNFKDWAYIPLASTWINKCAYEDLAPKERAYQMQRERAAAQQFEDTRPKPALPSNHFLERYNRGEFSQ